MTKKRFRLYVKPTPLPRWWPRNGRLGVWCGVLEDGAGWVVGAGDKLTAAQVKTAKKLLDVRRPRFRQEAV